MEHVKPALRERQVRDRQQETANRAGPAVSGRFQTPARMTTSPLLAVPLLLECCSKGQ